MHSLQVENIFPVAHNEEKVKTTSLCFLCSYVRKRTYLCPNTAKVIIKTCLKTSLQWHMMRKKIKTTSLCFLCPYVRKRTYLCPNTAKVIIKTCLKTSLQWHKMRKKSRLLLYVSYVLMSEWAYSCQNTIRRTINSFTCPLVNPSTVVNFSARNLTLKVAFLFTNCPSCRKKTILAKVCFDAKRG